MDQINLARTPSSKRVAKSDGTQVCDFIGFSCGFAIAMIRRPSIFYIKNNDTPLLHAHSKNSPHVKYRCVGTYIIFRSGFFNRMINYHKV